MAYHIIGIAPDGTHVPLRTGTTRHSSVRIFQTYAGAEKLISTMLLHAQSSYSRWRNFTQFAIVGEDGSETDPARVISIHNIHPQFKIGDKVRFKDATGKPSTGSIGTIRMFVCHSIGNDPTLSGAIVNLFGNLDTFAYLRDLEHA